MYSSSQFELKYSFEQNTMNLFLQIHIPFVLTSAYGGCISFLEHHCPGTLQTTCFNDQNLPFYIEAKNTELGHLFEHILLDQLCSEKISQGHKNVMFSGITQWDWEQKPYGSFQILINLKRSDLAYFNKSLNSSIILFEKLISAFPNSTRLIHSEIN